jgi:P-type Cu+ transporter
VSTRTLVPVAVPPANRLQVDPEPCGACGADVDPLRAPQVVAQEDGVRVFCGNECLTAYRGGARPRRRHTPSMRTPPGGSPKHTPTSLPPPALPAWTEADAAPPAHRHLLGAGAGSVVVAVVLALWPRQATALVSSLLSASAALIALRMSVRSVRDIGILTWLLGPLGTIGAAVAAYDALVRGSGGSLGLVGAALAAAAMLARASFDAEARRPVRHAVKSLLARLPTETRVPVRADRDPLIMAVERVDASRIRTGEEVIAMKGDVLAVDGVVQAGEAAVFPYPGATTKLHRKTGDALLAGATVVEGAVRVLAARVGDDRALVRLARFDRASERDAASLVRIADEVARWGGVGSLGLALAAAALAGGQALTTPLSAASAILIAAPLLAFRRAAEWPFVGAAATAGARGIVFQSAGALDQAGHVSLIAMAPNRTLTEGTPEVVEAHFMGDGDGTDVLALAAAAELAVGDHPIARAIGGFAATKGVTSVDIRRAVSVPGRGVTALAPNGDEVVIGSRRLLLDHGISVASADADATRAEAAGRTAVFVSVAGRVRAVLTLQDHLRVGARAAVQRMFDMGLEVVLLTGAQRGPIEELATGLDIAHVKAELLPEERGHEVRSLREAGARVAVVGYPGEDDAALAAADVGVALAAAGGPAGDKAIALVSEDVRDAAAALWIARAARNAAMSSAQACGVGFAVIVGAAAAGLIEPAIAAVFALAVDAYSVRAGARLLRRIALRLPAWT